MQLLSVEQGSMNISASDHDPLKSLALDYMNLFSHGSAFSDVVFCVEGKQVHAHRCILAARSNFFRMIFCKGDQSGSELGSPISANLPLQIPVEIVGYDVFVILLQFLYSGQLILAFQQGRSKCLQRGCWHAHCSSSVDLALDTLHAANFFGVEQLSTLIQRHLGAVVEKISIDDVMRVLVAAKKQGLHPLWETCSELVAKSGLTVDALRKHLPRDIAAEIEEMRVQRGYGRMHHSSPSADRSSAHVLQQRIRKMRQALDSLDVELVRLMVMGEGLDLDSALALHYSVNNCSRDVVKALLEMGAVNVNHPDAAGRTALHVACEMACPDMISVLLDHHASPLLQSDGGDAPLDIIQALISRADSGSPSNAVDHNKLRLCLELLQSAAYVADKEEEEDLSDGVVTEPSSDNTSRSGLHVNQQPSNPMDIPDCSSAFEPINPRSGLNPDWASIESSCSFEQETPNHSHHHQHNQISFLHNDSILRMASPQSSGGLNTMISSNLDGFLYPDFRMAMLGAAGSCNPSSTTIF